uniref:F-box/LRR-repeat protein 15 isoform X2 n=1 Tax=Myxine glutinosa TaxID=7769 RepID=UPI00358E106A
MAYGEQKSPKSLLDLPWDDILIPHVLSHLSLLQLLHFQAVSQGFCMLVKKALSASTHLDFSEVGTLMEPAKFEELFSTPSGGLQCLHLSACGLWLTDHLLLPLLLGSPRLDTIDLSGCRALSTRVLQVLITHCPKLRSLRLADCPWVDIASMNAIFLSAKNLQVFDVADCQGVSDHWLAVILPHAQSLVSLRLASNYCITTLGLELLAKYCGALEHLDVAGCFRITEHGIRIVKEYCPALKFLCVDGCPGISEAELHRLQTDGVEICRNTSPHDLLFIRDFSQPMLNLQI